MSKQECYHYQLYHQEHDDEQVHLSYYTIIDSSKHMCSSTSHQATVYVQIFKAYNFHEFCE